MSESGLGAPVEGWTPPAVPGRMVLRGRYAVLEPLDPERHAAALFAAQRGAPGIWDYMPYGPFADEAAFRDHLAVQAAADDPRFFAICDAESGLPGGVCSYLRITPGAGTIELGHIWLSPALQGTRIATEAFTLMIGWAFDAGYRRFEWKCNALNQASRRAAQRLGLSYEGVFRQAAVIKGRNRDTAWFVAIDAEWPALRQAYADWLAPANFDGEGRQRRALSALTASVLAARDPTL